MQNIIWKSYDWSKIWSWTSGFVKVMLVIVLIFGIVWVGNKSYENEKAFQASITPRVRAELDVKKTLLLQAPRKTIVFRYSGILTRVYVLGEGSGDNSRRAWGCVPDNEAALYFNDHFLMETEKIVQPNDSEYDKAKSACFDKVNVY